MLDDAFQAGTDAAIRDALQRPTAPRVQTPKFSLWGTLGAAAGGIPRGVAEVGASAIDLMSGLTKVDVSAETMAASMTPDGLAEMQRRAKETLETGFRDNDVARSLRAASDYYMPDPITSHGAEIIASDFLRVATKAIGAAVTLGPIPGAIVAGAEEGFTQSDRLAAQGVDVATRSQVGAVTGAVTAAGFALPVAGKTWAQTAGLAVAGGPASFIGQNAASRAILENADYTKQAQQFDPFDPVGLTLSTLLPFGFGALAMRGAKGRVPVGVEDAARVTLLRENADAHRTTPAADIPGGVRHEQALTKALDQLAAGERVDVSDVAPPRITPEQRTENFRAWFEGSKVVDEAGEPLVVYHGTQTPGFDTFERGNVPPIGGVRFQDAQGFYFTKDPGYANDYGETLMPVYLSLKNPYMVAPDQYDHTYVSATRRAELEAQGYDGLIAPAVDGGRFDEIVVFRPEQIKSAIGNSGRFDPASASLTDPLVQFEGRLRELADVFEAERAAAMPPRADAPSAPAQSTDPQTVGNPRDLVAETVALRKQQSVLTKLLECLNG